MRSDSGIPTFSATRGERHEDRETCTQFPLEMPAALEAADDFAKPRHWAELEARVRSLLRSKYYETIAAQAEELRVANETLEGRVRAQVDELERMGEGSRVSCRHRSPTSCSRRRTSGCSKAIGGRWQSCSAIFAGTRRSRKRSSRRS